MDEQGSSQTFFHSTRVALLVVTVMWMVKIIETFSQVELGYFGLVPRSLTGLPGILLSPMVHGDYNHLIANSFPLLILVTGLFYFYEGLASRIFLLIYFGSQVGIWFLARPAYHIGASGIVYGMFGFLVFSGIFRRSRESLALTAAVFVLYQGFLFGLFPSQPNISWESHLIGFIVGAILAFIFRRVKMKGEVTYDWDEENEDEEPPPSGVHLD